MPLPMIGTVAVRIDAAHPFTIHSDEYMELRVTQLDDGEAHIVRVPSHAFRVEPEVGENVVLSLLMGQVTEVRANS